VNIGVFVVDHAKCPRGHYTPIRPSSLLPPETDPRWKEKGDEPVVFACNECRRVYSVNKDELEQRPTPWGVEPYNPEAPTRVFQVPIECGDLGCLPQLLVHVTLKSNTTVEELLEEKLKWRWADLKCPKGHEIPWPQWE
jgi:hypothetical protein